MLFVWESKITLWIEIDRVYGWESELAWFLYEGSKLTSVLCAGRNDVVFECGIEIDSVQCGDRNRLGFVWAKNDLVSTNCMGID